MDSPCLQRGELSPQTSFDSVTLRNIQLPCISECCTFSPIFPPLPAPSCTPLGGPLWSTSTSSKRPQRKRPMDGTHARTDGGCIRCMGVRGKITRHSLTFSAPLSFPSTIEEPINELIPSLLLKERRHDSLTSASSSAVTILSRSRPKSTLVSVIPCA